MSAAIKKLTIQGFKSIRDAEIDLKSLNIIIGANGAGKSNLVQVFRMLRAMVDGQFSKFIKTNGGADSFLHNGFKHTPEISICVEFLSRSANAEGTNAYHCTLTPTVDEKFLLSEKRKYVTTSWRPYGSPSEESRLAEQKDERSASGHFNGVGHFVYETISSWMTYHFHDTSYMAPMRRAEIVEDYHGGLRSDASNIAPWLLFLKNNNNVAYTKIVDAVRLVIPFFDDFRLDVSRFGAAEKVNLSWKQKGSDYPMQPYHLSDGSIRFICLATALLQPYPPSTIVIDEPELGLHPFAIAILADLIQEAATHTQVIVATQSPALIDQFAIDDIIVASREDGASVFKRLNKRDFSTWLKDYSVGELWTKNVIEGGPANE